MRKKPQNWTPPQSSKRTTPTLKAFFPASQSGSSSEFKGQPDGFTLVELLLTVVILMLLMGAMVFNFNRMQTGAGLDSGALQLQTLFRLAEAQAAEKGRRVQMTFHPDEEDSLAASIQSIQIAWEPDPLQKPGTYETFRLESWNIEQLNDLVAVEDVLLYEDSLPSLPSSNTDEPVEEPEPDFEFDDSFPEEEFEFLDNAFPPITFYPDSTSDSALITLVSRNDEDRRRKKVYWHGLTSSVRIQTIFPPENEFLNPMENDGPKGGQRPPNTGTQPLNNNGF